MHPVHRQQFNIEEVYLDCFGRCKPSALLYFAQVAAERHCLVLSADWQTMQEKGLFWAIIRQKVQITRLPGEGETITVETWPMPTTRVAYPRSTVAYDQNGNELFRAISLWILMDVHTRAMVLPGKSGILVEGSLRGNELATPGSLLPKGLDRQQLRMVRFSELDRNGHMNNTRYLDWVMDLLPAPFHKDHTPREITVCYHTEATEDEQICLSWSLKEDSVLTADGHRTGQDTPGGKGSVFSAQVRF